MHICGYLATIISGKFNSSSTLATLIGLHFIVCSKSYFALGQNLQPVTPTHPRQSCVNCYKTVVVV